MSEMSLEGLVDDLESRPVGEGVTLALVVAVDGRVLAESYGQHPATPFTASRAVSADDTLISWSMAKSVTHALVGLAVDDGILDLDRPGAVPEWRGTAAESITLVDLLEMRSGLAFVEDYVDGEASDCIHMLFSGDEARGVHDMGSYAASRQMAHPPGEFWSYSSGTTNIICRMLGDAVAGGDVAAIGPERRRAAMESFMMERLLIPAGMGSATARFDGSGTFIGSSFLYATARDFLRFGELYRRDGLAEDGTRVLPTGWRDHARTVIAHDPDGAGPEGFDYGRHWWIWPDIHGSMAAQGYQGQFVLVVPEWGLTLVHLGITDVGVAPGLVERLGRIARTAAGML